jgi:hypothetical protein
LSKLGIIAIDFDGTIVEHKFPEIGKLLPGAKEVINKLAKSYTIIIWTCRNHEETSKEFLDMITFLLDNDIEYHYINQNDPKNPFQPYPKIFANIYIDDRSLGGFPGWDVVEAMLL